MQVLLGEAWSLVTSNPAPSACSLGTTLSRRRLLLHPADELPWKGRRLNHRGVTVRTTVAETAWT